MTMIQYRDPGAESEAAMTDDREKKGRVFYAWVLVDDRFGADHPIGIAFHRHHLEQQLSKSGICARLIPCRVIVEDEP